jgi:hypothetical protein
MNVPFVLSSPNQALARCDCYFGGTRLVLEPEGSALRSRRAASLGAWVNPPSRFGASVAAGTGLGITDRGLLWLGIPQVAGPRAEALAPRQIAASSSVSSGSGSRA